MGIKLSEEAAAPALKEAFGRMLGSVLVGVRQIFLPYLSASVALFALGGYVVYARVLSGPFWPRPVLYTLVLGLAVVYGTAALAYAGVLSFFSALKRTAAYAEDFCYDLLEAVKEKLRARLDGLEDGLAKQQAHVLLDNSLREVLAPLKQWRFSSAPALLTGVLLSLVTCISRSVFLARLARVSGKTVQLSRLFASRATLAGALFLNMRWLAALALWAGYGAGFLFLAVNLYWVW